MSQHDFNIANQGFPNTRSDLNSALVALASNSSGATQPTTMYSYQWWLDTNTTPTTLKMRNTANDAWISVMFLNQSTNLMSLGATTITSASATSLAVGLTGATNPAFTVDSSTALQVAGLKVTGAVTGGTVAVVATDSGSNTNLTVNAKGTGTIGIGSVSTGAVTITPNTAVTGTLGVGSAPSAGNNFTIVKNATGATTAIGALVNSQIQSDVTSAFRGYQVTLSTQATAFTVTDSSAYAVFQGTLGVGSTVTNQYGFNVASSLTGATNNYGFYSNIAAGTNRFNLYMNGTANNYMAGSLGIGATSLTAYNLRMSKTITGGTSAFGIAQDSTIQSDVTTSAYGYRSALATQAAAFTLPSLFHIIAEQGTFGATSAVTSQYGMYVASNMTGATNNYGFYSNIASGTGRFNFYAAGTAANFFGGIVTVPAGTAALPAIISTTGTADTGQFFPAADTIAYSTAGTERMRIGSTGLVSIGTASSTYKLHVQSSAVASLSGFTFTPQIVTEANATGGIGMHSPTANQAIITHSTPLDQNGASIHFDGTARYMSFCTVNDTERMRLDSSGRLGIGLSPSYQLELSTDSAAKPGAGGLWTVASDERIKNNIVSANLDRCYEIVKSVPLKYFSFSENAYSKEQVTDRHNLGWIAQDVQKVFKNAVSVKPFTLKTGEVIDDCLDLNSGQMIAAMYGAVQALMVKVETLTGRITALESA